MHEMALAQSIVTMVAERARAEGACVVRRVGLAVGALGHVEPEALAFCLDSAALGSAIEGVTFDIATPPGRAYCFDCMGEVTIAPIAAATHCASRAGRNSGLHIWRSSDVHDLRMRGRRGAGRRPRPSFSRQPQS
jgi:hydrogenase nickel incorporation protein HypA/HybF